ncbi:flippase-like domain-containing protein [Candidatus Peregrinibacteria bacterium]|nr:flippase-like domain-containing protein [Candidatus Peregrinibacteria bacterium]
MIAKTFSFIQKFFFYILLAAVALFLIFKAKELQNIFSLFLKGGPYWITLAIICQITTYIFNALTYKDILRIFDSENIMTTRELMESSIVMLFLSKMVPSFGISNNWFFLSMLRKRNMPVRQGIQIVVLEAFSYYASLIVMLLIGFIYLMLQKEMTGFIFNASIIGTILMIATICFVGWILGNKKQLHKTICWFKRHFGKAFRSKGSLLHDKTVSDEDADIESAIDVVKSKLNLLFWPTVWQTLMFLVNAYTVYFLFRSFNFDISFGVAMAGFIMAQVLSLVSLIPSGIGIFEGAMVIFYTNLGVPFEMAVVITLLFRGLSLFAPIPLGSYLYKKLSDKVPVKTW